MLEFTFPTDVANMKLLSQSIAIGPLGLSLGQLLILFALAVALITACCWADASAWGSATPSRRFSWLPWSGQDWSSWRATGSGCA